MPEKAAVRPIDLLTAVGVVVGKVTDIFPHPNAERLRIAEVVITSDGEPLQIVFGGLVGVVEVGDMVPVAPPTKSCRVQGVKMRRRKFRGVISRGEICSLYELGLSSVDTDQVAILNSSTEIGTPLAALVSSMRAYGELWTVFRRPVGFNEGELRRLYSAA